ncbi:hypothetical protein IMCC3135_29030 [Granulosicoccus antarcticus IMCC3135]|uniref:Nickel uptake substrate-specific transmembrane region n=1 Tax=Granulosicoccus antarcticus IMCC3135 TaxID=1192854 RepID=A0A2Z2P5A2_9GAMM|nr:hypothetical protein IMCC3135_29030 [Granulosicoccus antarcticus IMCC3135]
MPALVLSALLASHSGIVTAHEYWLDPVDAQWQVGDELQADIRNGQDFTGTAYPFDPQGLSRAGLISDTKRVPLSGRLGDYPAINIPLSEAGLNLLLLETTQRELKYKDLEAFETFLDYHALDDIKQKHKDRGMPTNDIIEHYYRYCKTLVMVDAKDYVSSDSETGAQINPVAALQLQDQRFELLALDSPFNADSLSLQLLFEDKPVQQRQIELFHRDSSDAVVRITALTDSRGMVDFDVSSAGDYLVNSVLVLESETTQAQWVTLWASLSFQQE